MARRPGAHGQPRGAARVSGGSRRDPAARRPSRARPAAPPARACLMATLTAPDGTQLVYDACEPLSPRAAVLFLHGWSDHAGRWSGVGERLRDAGFAVYLLDRKSTRLNSSHLVISYAVFCLKKKKKSRNHD